jgi:hypothetical protein
MSGKNSQKAGSDSTQLLVQGDLNIQGSGVTLTEVNQLIDLHLNKIVSEFRLTAADEARVRVEEFEKSIFKKLAEKGLLEAIKKPSFQKDLFDSTVAVASSDNNTSEEILVNLLKERAADTENNTLKIAISKAIQTADKLDTSTLNGLGAEWAFTSLDSKEDEYNMKWTVVNMISTQYVKAGLPKGRHWQTNLDELGLVKIEPSILERNKVDDIILDKFKSFLVPGIPNEHIESVREEVKILNPEIERLWFEHPLNEDHIMLSAVTEDEWKEQLTKLGVDPSKSVVYTLGYVNGFGQLDPNCKARLEELISANPAISEFRAWWNKQLPDRLSASGRVIAHLHSREVLNIPNLDLSKLFSE